MVPEKEDGGHLCAPLQVKTPKKNQVLPHKKKKVCQVLGCGSGLRKNSAMSMLLPLAESCI